MKFQDRVDAGKRLAGELLQYRGNQNVLVVALPRGGVVVGAEVARILDAPLDIVVPRKIGAPDNPEYAIGAITETGEAIFNERERTLVPQDWLEKQMKKERQEARRRLRLYRGDRPATPFKDKIVILVDDGLATGLTMRAAIQVVRAGHPAKIVMAVPVAAGDPAARLAREVDEMAVLGLWRDFRYVAAFYEFFPEVSDEEVVALLGAVESRGV